MRLITHTDLDGVMCAVLLTSVEEVDEIKYIDPATIQAGKLNISKNDIISDLPYDKRCGMWFDHHESSKPKEGVHFEGAHAIAPSAARVIYSYYSNPFLEKYADAVAETDKIDSGIVPLEQVNNPSGWFLLSCTFDMGAEKIDDDRFRDYVIKVLRKNPDVNQALADPKIGARAKDVLSQFSLFASILKAHTKMIGNVAFSDMRSVPNLPKGSNFLVYSLFPDAVTSVRLMPVEEDDKETKVSVGHNIYGKKSTFDVGALMKSLGGGGHRAVGGANVPNEKADEIAKMIINKLNAYCEP